MDLRVQCTIYVVKTLSIIINNSIKMFSTRGYWDFYYFLSLRAESMCVYDKSIKKRLFLLWRHSVQLYNYKKKNVVKRHSHVNQAPFRCCKIEQNGNIWMNWYKIINCNYWYHSFLMKVCHLFPTANIYIL